MRNRLGESKRVFSDSLDCFVSRAYLLLVLLASGLCLVILLGGPARLSGPAWAGAHALVDWLPWPAYATWGGLFAAGAVSLFLTAGHRWAVYALQTGMNVYLFLSLGFVHSALIAEPILIDGVVYLPALTGAVTYFIVFLAHAVLADHIKHRGWR